MEISRRQLKMSLEFRGEVLSTDVHLGAIAESLWKLTQWEEINRDVPVKREGIQGLQCQEVRRD